jgi:hypothetical protein
VLWKRMAVLVTAAVMVLSMLPASAPAFAVPEECPGGELQPGQSGERERSPHAAPSGDKPGSLHRDSSGDVHDTSDDQTGRGELCVEI